MYKVTPQDIKTIKTLRKEGKSYVQIQELTGIHRTTANKTMLRHNIRIRPLREPKSTTYEQLFTPQTTLEMGQSARIKRLEQENATLRERNKMLFAMLAEFMN